ncbi:MAG TPA: GFA family protein [Verrucomicrobiae bacterium]|jgi:hypothetical protein|nr:GFA family protein [Verrucomicrobiae bacterium]
MERTYRGSCHCGTVRFEADIDLCGGTFKCNCEMCTKTRSWGAIVKPGAFRLIAGESALVDYRPDAIHHVFCRHCGVRPFAWGDDPALGGKFYTVRVYCLDDVDVDELMRAPVAHYDGRNDNYQSAPEEIRHL